MLLLWNARPAVDWHAIELEDPPSGHPWATRYDWSLGRPYIVRVVISQSISSLEGAFHSVPRHTGQ
jgi:hypothetical protein